MPASRHTRVGIPAFDGGGTHGRDFRGDIADAHGRSRRACPAHMAISTPVVADDKQESVSSNFAFSFIECVQTHFGDESVDFSRKTDLSIYSYATPEGARRGAGRLAGKARAAAEPRAAHFQPRVNT